MSSAAPSLTPPMRRRHGIRLAAALLVLAVAGIAVSTCEKSTEPSALGTCTRPDNTVLAYNISQQECQSTCPSCTWHQNQ
jgi:hypothetical protein